MNRFQDKLKLRHLNNKQWENLQNDSTIDKTNLLKKIIEWNKLFQWIFFHLFQTQLLLHCIFKWRHIVKCNELFQLIKFLDKRSFIVERYWKKKKEIIIIIIKEQFKPCKGKQKWQRRRAKLTMVIKQHNQNRGEILN